MARIKINPYCTSSFLAFRYIVDKNAEWLPGIKPRYPALSTSEQVHVRNETEVHAALKNLLKSQCGDTTGILLSGGIDSAILAALLPPGTKAFTIRFVSQGFTDESTRARAYCDAYELEHHIVDVTWEDYVTYSSLLIKNKNAPLHPIEVALYKAALEASNAGVAVLVVGNGADSTFGGMDKLLSKDFKPDEFCNRYTFVDPFAVLTDPVSVRSVYEPYFAGESVDVQRFLKIVHGTGIIQSFDNAITAAGLKSFEPFEHLYLDEPLDTARIRSGEPKYILRSLFTVLYPGSDIPEKIPFSRPMDAWLKNRQGPRRPEFRHDADYSGMSGDQRWLIYSLEEFLNLIDPLS